MLTYVRFPDQKFFSHHDIHMQAIMPRWHSVTKRGSYGRILWIKLDTVILKVLEISTHLSHTKDRIWTEHMVEKWAWSNFAHNNVISSSMVYLTVSRYIQGRLWGTQAGTIDRGAKTFFRNKIGGGNLFWKILGGRYFSRKRGWRWLFYRKR